MIRSIRIASDTTHFNVRCSGLARGLLVYSLPEETIVRLLFPATAPLARFVRLAEQREYDTTWLLDEMRVLDGRLLCGKERCCEIRLAALRRAARMELKRVSCGCFGGRSFAMSPLTLLAPTTLVLVDRDLKLHFNSEMLAKLLRNRWFLHCSVPKYCSMLIKMRYVVHK